MAPLIDSLMPRLTPRHPKGEALRHPPWGPWASRLIVALLLALCSTGWAGLAHSAAQAGSPPAGGAAAEDTGSWPASSRRQRDLVEHLRRQGFVFYGAWWCPACRQQKLLFGRQAQARLPYVECDRESVGRQRCQASAIQAYPTWIRGSERQIGVLSLEELERWSGFRGGGGGGAQASP